MSETEMTTIPSVKLVGNHLMATIGGHTKIFKVDATQLLIDLEAAHATATAKIEALEAKLAKAKTDLNQLSSRSWLKPMTRAEFAKQSLANLQKENTDA